MKGIYSLILMLTLFFNVQVSFTQESHNHDHGRFDEIFGPWTLSKVINEAEAFDRYHSEIEVQHFVDSSYMTFQGQIKQLISQNPALSETLLVGLFLQEHERPQPYTIFLHLRRLDPGQIIKFLEEALIQLLVFQELLLAGPFHVV